jgi:hypothetical protein
MDQNFDKICDSLLQIYISKSRRNFSLTLVMTNDKVNVVRFHQNYDLHIKLQTFIPLVINFSCKFKKSKSEKSGPEILETI